MGMSSFRPLPQCQKDSMIHFSKGFFADHMPVIIGPPPNLWVQLSNEIACCGLLVDLDDFSNVLEKGMDVLFRGLDEQFSVVLAQMLPKEVKTVFDMCDEGFLLRKLKSPLLYELLHKGFYFVFQDLFGFTGYNKVIGKAHEIDLFRASSSMWFRELLS